MGLGQPDPAPKEEAALRGRLPPCSVAADGCLATDGDGD